MRPPMATIFFMTYFYRASGGYGPLAILHGSANGVTRYIICHIPWVYRNGASVYNCTCGVVEYLQHVCIIWVV